MANLKGCFTSKSDEWETPIWLYDMFDDICHFTLDPCASHFNKKCNKYFTKEDDGLYQSWKGHVVFCNPPYSNISAWCEKCRNEYVLNKTKIALLIPARTDTSYFHDYILPHARIIFLRGRLHFSNSKGSAPFPSIVCLFGFEEGK